jgi:phosphoglucosamine mutase
MISASHNPFMDNGVKIFSRDGFKLADEKEQEIESKLFCDELAQHRPTDDKVGKIFRIDDARGRYICFLKATFPAQMTLDGLKIILDCSNGAAYKIAPAVFEELGADVHKLGVEPNGININEGCGALYPDKLAAAVKQEGADLGIALDGDADRAILVDEKGEIFDGDHVLAVCAEYLAGEGRLNNGSIVGTSMSNIGLEVFLRDKGLNLIRAKVGDRYVVEEMRRRNLMLGGEQSGHVIFMEKNTTGDGIITALQVLAALKKCGSKLSQLRAKLKKFPQILKNFRVPHKPPIESLSKTAALIRRVEGDLGQNGRVVVRYSGTELLARVMVEGESQTVIDKYAADIAATMAKEIGN